MVEHRIIADPRSRYGAPKPATRRFILQRVTGALNILFSLFLIWFIIRLERPGGAEAVALVANPLVGMVLILLLVNVATHMRIGMHEIITDYLDEGRRNRLGNTLNNFYAGFVVVVGVVSVIKIVLWG